MTMTCATLYYDTEAKTYLNFNGERALGYMVKPSQDSPTFREVIGLWSEVLQYLGPEAINMRRVCSFFLKPDFRPLYERSPVLISCSYPGFLDSLRNRREPLTNTSLYLDKLFVSPLCASLDLPLILPRMKNISALPQTRFDPEFFSGQPWLPLVRHLLHQHAAFDCAIILNQAYFPNLAILEIYFAPQVLNLDFVNSLSHSALRRLELKFCNKQSIDLSFLGAFLKAFPYLEQLEIHCDYNPLVGTLDLEPHSLPNLKACKMTGIHWTSLDLSNFLAAAQHLRVLGITYELKIKGAFKYLEANEFPDLEKVSITNADLSLEDMLCLLKAAPRLKELNWLPGQSADVNQGVPKDASFPQLQRALFVPASNKQDGDSFWHLIEKMPNLYDCSMRNLGRSGSIIDYRSVGAYSKLVSMNLYHCQISAGYFTVLLNHALHLKSLFIDGGRVSVSTKELQEKALLLLESLCMQSVDITEAVLIDILKRAKNLEDLTFHYSFLIREKSPSFDLPAGSMPKLKVFESKESSYKNDCFNQEQVISILKAAPNLERLNVPDRYLFVLNLFETGALLNLRKVDFWYKSVTPDVRARLVEIIRRVAPNVTIEKADG